MFPVAEPHVDEPVNLQRLEELVVFEYRSVVLNRLGVTAEWRGLDWTEAAACTETVAATEDVCGRCPVVAECLPAAIVSDDRADWRGGLHRTDRQHLWAGLERTYHDLRDLELMRVDPNRFANRTQHVSPITNGHRR